jgi:hypothetical protein
MKVCNTIIITDDKSEIVASAMDDQGSFSGNLVFNRSELPPSLVEQLDRVTGSKLLPDNAAAANTHGRLVNA